MLTEPCSADAVALKSSKSGLAMVEAPPFTALLSAKTTVKGTSNTGGSLPGSIVALVMVTSTFEPAAAARAALQESMIAALLLNSSSG